MITGIGMPISQRSKPLPMMLSRTLWDGNDHAERRFRHQRRSKWPRQHRSGVVVPRPHERRRPSQLKSKHGKNAAVCKPVIRTGGDRGQVGTGSRGHLSRRWADGRPSAATEMKTWSFGSIRKVLK